MNVVKYGIYGVLALLLLAPAGVAGAAGCHEPAVNAFEILVDLSGSLDDGRKGPANLLARMNPMIPDGAYTAALRSFYQYPHGDGTTSRLDWGIGRYDREAFQRAVTRLRRRHAQTPLGPALAESGGDLAQMTGAMALIIVSDFRWSSVFGNPAAEAAALLAKHPGLRIFAVCLSAREEHLKTARAVVGDGGRVYEGFRLASDPEALRAMIDEVFGGRDGCPADTYLSLDIAFAPGRAEVKSAHHDPLEKAAGYLRQYPGATAVIEGHTDGRGAEAENRALSENRARNVKRYLVEKLGIGADRLEAAGYGASRPIADNATERGRRQNRRVDIIIRGSFQAE